MVYGVPLGFVTLYWFYIYYVCLQFACETTDDSCFPFQILQTYMSIYTKYCKYLAFVCGIYAQRCCSQKARADVRPLVLLYYQLAVSGFVPVTGSSNIHHCQVPPPLEPVLSYLGSVYL